MARRRIVGSRGFVRPPKKTVMWIGDGVGLTTLNGATSTLVAVLGADPLLLRPFTIMRTHLELMFTSDQSGALEIPIGSYGEIVVTDTASAIGITAIPSPSAISGEAEAGWFVWQALWAKFTLDPNGDTDRSVKFTIDSKAMRKVGPDDDVVSVVTIDGAAGAQMVSQGRTLIQLH